MKNHRSLRRLSALLLAAALCLSLASCGGIDAPAPAAPPPFDGLEVTVFNAGKADAILLETPTSAVLIDCGGKDFGPSLADELAARGVERLDALILSHFDKDHVGGAAKVLSGVGAARVLQNACPRPGAAYDKYLRALWKLSLEPETVREDLSFTLDGVRYTVEPPRREHYDRDESNNSSLIVTAVYGKTRLLFMGDAQTARICEYLASSPPRCDLIKLPHHGEKEKMLDALLASVKPEYAVITCSAAEPEAASTAAALQAAGVESYLTRLGSVRIRSDGETLDVSYLG